MSSEVITKDKIDERGHLSKDVLKRKEDIVVLREIKRGRLIFSITIERNKRKRTSKKRNIKI